MKNSLQFLVTGVLLSFLMASCSQSKDLASEDRGPQYRFNKVYIGNKIVYRGLNDKEDKKDRLLLENLKDIQEQKETVSKIEPAAPKREAKAQEKKSFLTNNKSVFKNIGKVGKAFAANLSEIKRSAVRGTLMHESAQKVKKDFSATAEDKTTAGASEIFAILGFIFGLASLASFSGGIWLIGAALGLVFSILGWNSQWHIFALLGLIFSVVGVVLFLL